MTGTVYLKTKIKGKSNEFASGGTTETRTIEGVTSVGIAGPFLVLQFEDGTTVMEKAEGFDSVQFTPNQAADSEDVGQSEDDTSG